MGTTLAVPAPASEAQEQRLPARIEEFPCTVGQRKTWELHQAHPGNPTLNIAARWRLEGRIAPALLERSLQLLIDRHEPLRTSFEGRDGIPVQLVLPTARPWLRVIDLSGLSSAERLEAAADLAREEARRPFDLAQPPLLRAVLVRLEPAVADLLVTTHYMVGDCWSNGILAQEMSDFYDALRAGEAPALPELDLQFGDYARWQDALFREGSLDPALGYWRERLADRPAFQVPIDRPLPANPSGAGDILGMPVPPALIEAAQTMARERGATFFMLGVATMAVLLHRWTGAAEILFGTQVAGRDELELESLVGPFVNTVVLRIDLAGDPSFSALLDQVRQTVGEALEHAAAPIERVLEALPPAAESAPHRRDPLTAVNFLIQRAFTRDAAHGEFALKGVPNFSPGSKYDLNVFLVERPSGWRASCEYDPELFERDRVDWLVRSFLNVLGWASARPDSPVSSISLLDGSAPHPEAMVGLEQRLTAELPAIPEPADGSEERLTAQLATLWAKVLRRKSVPLDGNFFELGGDSIRAARLLALTRQTIGRTITLGQLFKAPTLGEMAAALDAEHEAVPSGVVMVQPEGAKPPIFAINNTGIFYTLSRHLGPEQPFVVVQALDPDISPSVHPREFRALSARYVEAIRQIRPHGPYALIGLCAAGKVALEVAQQLSAAGEQVPLLAVVDCWAPGHWRGLGAGRRLLARANLRFVRLARQLQRIRQGTLSLRGFVANRAIVRGTRNAAFELFRRGGVLPRVPPGVQNNLFVNYLDRAAAGYEPQPYAGRVLVFHGPEQPRGRFLDPSFGWNELATGDIEVVAVPADQDTPFEDHHQGLFQGPGAEVIAERMSAALR